MIYTYKKLNAMMRDVQQKAENGNLSSEEGTLGTAAAYAVDLIDISREIGKPLDLSVSTADYLGACLLKAHAHNMASNHTIEESREILAKMLASYELFVLVNDFESIENAHKPKKLIDIVIVRSVMMPKPKLVLETIPDAKGVPVRFDIYEAARQTMQSIQLKTPKDNGMFFAGSIQPFHLRINKELVEPLSMIMEEKRKNKECC